MIQKKRTGTEANEITGGTKNEWKNWWRWEEYEKWIYYLFVIKSKMAMTKVKREILQPITVMCVKISWSFFVMEGSGICGENTCLYHLVLFVLEQLVRSLFTFCSMTGQQTNRYNMLEANTCLTYYFFTLQM